MNRFVAFLFALLLLGIGAYFGKQQLELQRRGLHAIGTVLDAKTRHEVRVGPGGIDSTSSNTGLIEFVPDGGAQAVRFSSDFWSRPMPGSEVQVIYLREDPAHAKVDTWVNWLWPPLLGVFGVWCLLYAFGLVSGDGLQSTSTGRGWVVFRWFD